jgi:hypothetical protein
MHRYLLLFFIFSPLVVAANAQPKQNPDLIEFISTKTGKSDGDVIKTFDDICPVKQSAARRRILAEYGSIFSATDTVTKPPTCMFEGPDAVADFQKKLPTGFVVIGNLPLTFQKAAADSLALIVDQAKRSGIRLRPLDGAITAGRTYDDTLRLWNSRFDPALRFWVSRRKISPADAILAASMTLDKQIEKVMAWEEQGTFFDRGRSGTIFASVAPPGASQHLSLIALDIAPPVTPEIRALMNANGWFQTVKGDLPHFTFLGVKESDLPSRGLTAIIYKGTQYWVPNVSFDVDSVSRPD